MLGILLITLFYALNDRDSLKKTSYWSEHKHVLKLDLYFNRQHFKWFSTFPRPLRSNPGLEPPSHILTSAVEHSYEVLQCKINDFIGVWGFKNIFPRNKGHWGHFRKFKFPVDIWRTTCSFECWPVNEMMLILTWFSRSKVSAFTFVKKKKGGFH